MRNKLTALTVLALSLGMITAVSAVSDDTSTSNSVTANVTTTIAMDVKPESLDYPDLTVGVLEKKSERDFGAVEVTNTGSEYIDKVWLGTSYPDTDPFGTGNPDAYDAGNFMVVKPDNSTSLNIRGNNSVYHYVNRKDFADDNPSSILTFPSDGTSIGSTSKQNDHVGQARFGDQWIYWYLPTGSSDLCNGEGAEVGKLRIGATPSDQDSLGSYDFTNSSQYKSYDIGDVSGTSRYGVTNNSVEFNLQNGEGNQTYDILTACPGNDNSVDSAHIVMNKYNADFNASSDLVSDGTATTYLLSTTNAADMLQPDESFTVETGMNTPRGVSAGRVQAGSLTVYATADTAAQE